MKAFIFLLSAIVVLVSAARAEQNDKAGPTKQILSGVWKMTKTTLFPDLVGSTWEFTSDGKYTSNSSDYTGTGAYELDGSILRIKVTNENAKKVAKGMTLKVRTLTEKEMILDKKKVQEKGAAFADNVIEAPPMDAKVPTDRPKDEYDTFHFSRVK